MIKKEMKQATPRLYGINLPVPTPPNACAAIAIARDLHQAEVNRRTRNTQLQKWDKYWVEVYNIVLAELKKVNL